MRSLLFFSAAAMLLVPLLGPDRSAGAELTGTTPGLGAAPAAPATPAPKPADKAPEAGSCGKYGTAIDFLDTPTQAAKQARREQKLVFVLHLSGIFEDPKRT